MRTESRLSNQNLWSQLHINPHGSSDIYFKSICFSTGLWLLEMNITDWDLDGMNSFSLTETVNAEIRMPTFWFDRRVRTIESSNGGEREIFMIPRHSFKTPLDPRPASICSIKWTGPCFVIVDPIEIPTYLLWLAQGILIRGTPQSIRRVELHITWLH